MIDISKYAAFHRAAIEKHKKEKLESIQKAYLQLEKIVNILKEKPAVRRVVLFGSLKNGTFIKGRSDIDIAVEGLPPSEYYSTCREIEDEIGIGIDLVDLDLDNRFFYNIVAKTGKIIYERSQ